MSALQGLVAYCYWHHTAVSTDVTAIDIHGRGEFVTGQSSGTQRVEGRTISTVTSLLEPNKHATCTCTVGT